MYVHTTSTEDDLSPIRGLPLAIIAAVPIWIAIIWLARSYLF